MAGTCFIPPGLGWPLQLLIAAEKLGLSLAPSICGAVAMAWLAVINRNDGERTGVIIAHRQRGIWLSQEPPAEQDDAGLGASERTSGAPALTCDAIFRHLARRAKMQDAAYARLGRQAENRRWRRARGGGPHPILGERPGSEEDSP